MLHWFFSPAEVLRGRTGKGSEVSSTLGVKPGTEVAVLISLRRLLTPWADSFHRLPMPCVDSLKRCDTEVPPPRLSPPFRSVLSMLMANKMEFRPEQHDRQQEELCQFFGGLWVFRGKKSGKTKINVSQNEGLHSVSLVMLSKESGTAQLGNHH